VMLRLGNRWGGVESEEEKWNQGAFAAACCTGKGQPLTRFELPLGGDGGPSVGHLKFVDWRSLLSEGNRLMPEVSPEIRDAV